MAEVIKNRYDFVVLFEVENGNPNGDPDAGNMPRVDPETSIGLVTDVCLKRKIRNYVETAKEDASGYRIYIKEGIPLERNDDEALKHARVEEKGAGSKKTGTENPDVDVLNYMCREFFDVRTFGAVMTTFNKKNSLNCGQVRGPVQLGFAKSIDAVFPQELTVARVTVTRESDAGKNSTFGKKYIIPYGLYRVEGYVSANLARKVTGFTEDDLQLLWQAIMNMFELDRSAARGNMAVRKLIVFKHESELGNAPAFSLFNKLKVERKDMSKPARCFEDYAVSLDTSMPAGVECIEML